MLSCPVLSCPVALIALNDELLVTQSVRYLFRYRAAPAAKNRKISRWTNWHQQKKWEKQNGFLDFISTRFHKKMVFSALSWELATNLPTSFEVYNHPVPFWEAGASSVLVLLYTSKKIMGGLRFKELMQWSTSSILPGHTGQLLRMPQGDWRQK